MSSVTVKTPEPLVSETVCAAGMLATGGSSLSLMVTVAVALPPSVVASVSSDEAMVTVKVSAASSMLSSLMVTGRLKVVAPARIVKVPAVTAVKSASSFVVEVAETAFSVVSVFAPSVVM